MPRQQPSAVRWKRRFQNREPTLAEIEEATLFSAYLVEKYGEQYAPIMDRLFIELEEARKRGGSPTERAKRILDEAEADGRLAAANITRKR
ncbi:hypothetical protein [Methylobacterium sp. NEAU K]|uniref:hypothetical protein n=1 Tax=Methylobacterium sp. NEAU K TaxID=3064946 RepID=UPI002733385C|nr:hypothetical protein [Methylobacterium sp. NEAU K]MDP4006510.1 hypothetical protein [Methylobacterium sp. NEAU K]